MTSQTTSPLRIDPTLVAAARRAGAIHRRSAPKQIEYWAELGKAVEHMVGLDDVAAVVQGVKSITVDWVASAPAAPADVFRALEESRQKGELAEKVSASVVYFEMSRIRPGLLDRVVAATGERSTGRFRNGEFIESEG